MQQALGKDFAARQGVDDMAGGWQALDKDTKP